VKNRSIPVPAEAQSKIEVRAFWTWRDSEKLIGPPIPDIAPLLSRGPRSKSAWTAILRHAPDYLKMFLHDRWYRAGPD
jgi:hypothetical protein